MSEAKSRLAAFFAGPTAPLEIYQSGKVRSGVKADVDALIADYERVRGALETIAEGHDVGRHDGLPEDGPAHDADTMFALARQALTQGESA